MFITKAAVVGREISHGVPLACVSIIDNGKLALVTPFKEAHIRTFGVGLLAIAALAVAGILLSRGRRPALVAAGPQRTRQVDDIYAAGW
jgi:hypothetical protein